MILILRIRFVSPGDSMLVCLCHGVNDRTIRETIADGAANLRDIGNACGAGTDCGSCRSMLRKMLQDEAGAAVYALPSEQAGAGLGGCIEGKQGSHRAA